MTNMANILLDFGLFPGSSERSHYKDQLSTFLLISFLAIFPMCWAKMMEENRLQNFNTFDGVFWYEIRQRTANLSRPNKVHCIWWKSTLWSPNLSSVTELKINSRSFDRTMSVFDNAILVNDMLCANSI